VRRSVELFGDTVQVSFNDRVMQFMGNDLAYKTRLIEGKFPNCDPIIPKDNTLVATVDRERLVSSLKIVSSISTEKLRPVKLTLSSGKLRVESEKAEYGEVSDELDAEYSGEDFQIGFNSRYLLDTLGVMSTAQVRMEFKNPMSPSVVREEADGSFLSVIMPLRIEW
jgi:DNA polymerase-3 subunit beta